MSCEWCLVFSSFLSNLHSSFATYCLCLASLDCAGFSNCHHARGTGYYPDSSALEGGFVDMRGAALHTLQVSYYTFTHSVSVSSSLLASCSKYNIFCSLAKNRHLILITTTKHLSYFLKDYLEGKASYVSVAMDNRAGIAYGTRLCIREMNHKYNRVIPFAVCSI